VSGSSLFVAALFSSAVGVFVVVVRPLEDIVVVRPLSICCGVFSLKVFVSAALLATVQT
jgi:hypothetical protein